MRFAKVWSDKVRGRRLRTHHASDEEGRLVAAERASPPQGRKDDSATGPGLMRHSYSTGLRSGTALPERREAIDIDDGVRYAPPLPEIVNSLRTRFQEVIVDDNEPAR